MTTEQLENAINNLEQYLSACSINNKAAALQSITDNYKELLKYKQESLALSPVTVGDNLYAVLMDEYLKSDDTVECYEIESIVIYREGILFKCAPYDDVICDLESLLNHEPYCCRYFFSNEEQAIKELNAARKRLNYEETSHE